MYIDMWGYYAPSDHSSTFLLLELYITLREMEAGHNPQANRSLKVMIKELKRMDKWEKMDHFIHKHPCALEDIAEFCYRE